MIRITKSRLNRILIAVVILLGIILIVALTRHSIPKTLVVHKTQVITVPTASTGTTTPKTATPTAVAKQQPQVEEIQIPGQGPITVDVPPSLTDPSDTTTTTVSDTTTSTTLPVGSPIAYGAFLDPTYVQNSTNPLVVTYSYTAGASTTVNGQDLELASLPSGTLVLQSDGSTVCTKNVSAKVDNGTCSVTYATFGTRTVVAEYTVNGTTYASPTGNDDVEPFTTTTMASISGGGSECGLVFDAVVTDQNRNVVTVGTVTMVISDVTEGWSDTVTIDVRTQCDFIENVPKMGLYTGCGISGNIEVSPVSGDTLTVAATYNGTKDWLSSRAPITQGTVDS